MLNVKCPLYDLHSYLQLLNASSETILHCELHDAWIAGARNLAETGAADRRDGVSEIGVIENVRRFSAQLQTLSFTDIECSGNTHIDRPASRRKQSPRPRRTVCTDGRKGEGARIEPPACGIAGPQIRLALRAIDIRGDYIGPLLRNILSGHVARSEERV